MTLHEPRVSWVSKLHDDVLFYIFQFNSDPSNVWADLVDFGRFDSIDEYIRILPAHSAPPLLTNRRTSQVCRQWRRVIVHSAAIWANAIDLDHLNQSGDDWRKEVLIRTGEAPLAVIGCIGDDEPNASGLVDRNVYAIPFTLHLLEFHWNRIQTLILCSNSATVDEKLYNLLTRPAPNLTDFVVSLKQHRGHNNIIPFLNQAPNLRTLRTDRLSFNLSEPSGWSSKIRHLDLTWPTKDISITELLNGLECMTSLEVLHLSDYHISRESDVDATAIPMIKLLALRHFTIADCDSAVPHLLSHMIIPPQCSFQGVSMIDDFLNEEFAERFSVGYAAFFKNNFAHPTVTHLTYSLRYGLVDDIAPDEDYTYFFAISFGDGSAESGYMVSRFLLTATFDHISTASRMEKALVLSCDLSNVTTLSLCLKFECPQRILQRQAFFDRMYDFLLSFQSVKTLHTDEDTLKLYMESERLCTTDVLLPNLDTVYTNLWDTGIVAFLHYRHRNADPTYEGSSVKHIKRLLFSRSSPVPRDKTDIIMDTMTSITGMSFGWEGWDT